MGYSVLEFNNSGNFSNLKDLYIAGNFKLSYYYDSSFNTEIMECYLEGCNNLASLSERYFAYCSLEHKAKHVNVDIEELPKRRRSIKEMQIIMQQWGQKAKEISAPAEILSEQQIFDLVNHI